MSLVVKNIIDRLSYLNKTVSVAESCTGGLLSYQFTRISGASAVFVGGIVSYQNAAKVNILGVDAHNLSIYSPYSYEVVNDMLDGVLRVTDSDFAIATSGIAGNIGFDSIKPGTVFIGMKAVSRDSQIYVREFTGSREEVQELASKAAIELFALYIDKAS